MATREGFEGLTGIEPALSAWEAVQTTLKVLRHFAETRDQAQIHTSIRLPRITAGCHGGVHASPRRWHVSDIRWRQIADDVLGVSG